MLCDAFDFLVVSVAVLHVDFELGLGFEDFHLVLAGLLFAEEVGKSEVLFEGGVIAIETRI